MFFLISACAERVWDSDEHVRSHRYAHGGQPSLTLITMINNSNGQGAHSALMINGSERVMYDPAGTFAFDTVPERNDVLFGITPQVLERYNSYHSRKTHHVVLQTVPVTRQVADAAMSAALSQGASGKALCANNTTQLVRRIPGFTDFPQSWRPLVALEAFGRYPGVKTEKYYEDDVGQN